MCCVWMNMKIQRFSISAERTNKTVKERGSPNSLFNICAIQKVVECASVRRGKHIHFIIAKIETFDGQIVAIAPLYGSNCRKPNTVVQVLSRMNSQFFTRSLWESINGRFLMTSLKAFFSSVKKHFSQFFLYFYGFSTFFCICCWYRFRFASFIYF